MADVEQKTDRFIAAKGGKGGWGNIHFATLHVKFRDLQSRCSGEEWEVSLELKLLTDVSLLGYPSVKEKSALLPL